MSNCSFIDHEVMLALRNDVLVFDGDLTRRAVPNTSSKLSRRGLWLDGR